MLSTEIIDYIEDTLLFCDQLITKIKHVKRQSAMDIAGVNLVSIIKRQGITEINRHLNGLSQRLNYLNQHVPNLHARMTYRLSDNRKDVLFDVALDNIVTDYQIHQDLDTALFGVERIQGELVTLLPYYNEEV